MNIKKLLKMKFEKNESILSSEKTRNTLINYGITLIKELTPSKYCTILFIPNIYLGPMDSNIQFALNEKTAPASFLLSKNSHYILLELVGFIHTKSQDQLSDLENNWETENPKTYPNNMVNFQLILKEHNIPTKFSNVYQVFLDKNYNIEKQTFNDKMKICFNELKHIGFPIVTNPKELHQFYAWFKSR